MNKAMLASWGRSFMAAAVSAFVATGGDVFSLDLEGAKAILTAGVVAILPVLLRYLNPSDTAFGTGAK
jgi:hypothetical protein